MPAQPRSIARRSLLATSAAATASLALPRWANAQAAATRLIVGFPPGGPADLLARALTKPLRSSLNTTVVVENRPGAGGRIAAMHVKAAAADGTSVLVTPASVITVAPHLYKSVRYEMGDFVPVTSLARLDLAVYAGPGAPDSVKDIPSMVKWLQDNPAKRNCGNPGLGSTPHLAALLLGRESGLNWELITYQGDAPAFIALLGGEIGIYVGSLAGGREHVRAGKIRLLATAGAQRTSFFPDLPTVAQSGYANVVVEDRHSVFVPKQTPAPVVAQLNEAIRAAMQSPELTDMLQRWSLDPSGESPEGFAAIVRGDSERWTRTIKALAISME